MNILLVDDSSTMRNIQRKALSTLEGVSFTEASDGVEGLAAIAAAKEPFRLILIDWNMPNMDGITMAERIRQTDKLTKLIMVTTEAEKSRVLQAIKLGVNSYIIKPFAPDAFVQKIQQVLAAA